MPAPRVSSDEQTRAAAANEQTVTDPAATRPLGEPSGDSSISRFLPGGDTADDAAGGGGLNLLTAMGVVIGLIFLGRALARRFLGGGATPAGQSSYVQVLGRTNVAPRNHVLLLRVGNRVLVVGDSAAGMRTLTEIHDPDEVADLLTTVSSQRPTSISAGFKQLLQSFNGSYRRDADVADLPDDADLEDREEFHVDRAHDGVSGLLGRLRSLGGKGKEER